MKRFTLATFFVVLLFLTSCSTLKQPEPTSTPAPPTPTTQPVLTATPITASTTTVMDEECSEEAVMQDAASFFDEFGYDYSLSYSKIDNLSILSSWVAVSDFLKPNATTSQDIESNSQAAMLFTVLTQASFLTSEKCASEVFSHMEVVVVDNEYNGWASQIINVKDVPADFYFDMETFKYEDLYPLFEKVKISYLRQDPPENLLANQDDPHWDYIRQTIVDVLPNKTENSSFVIIVDATGVDVLAQWQEVTDEDEDFKDVDLQITLEKIIAVLRLMPVKIDMLEITVVDTEGNIVIMGRTPELDLYRTEIMTAPFDFDLSSRAP